MNNDAEKKKTIENEKQKKKDTVARVTAFISLIVSLLTLYYVREEFRLSSGQARANVEVVDVVLVEPIAKPRFIKLKVRVKNSGQTAAVNVYGEMDYQKGMPDHEGKGNPATRQTFGSLGPDMEKTIIFSSNRNNLRNWPEPSLRRRDNSIYFYGTVWFTDETTNEERKEDWCYKIELKTEADVTERTKLERCGGLTYTSNENH